MQRLSANNRLKAAGAKWQILAYAAHGPNPSPKRRPTHVWRTIQSDYERTGGKTARQKIAYRPWARSNIEYRTFGYGREDIGK
jgi:hypothetical protein